MPNTKPSSPTFKDDQEGSKSFPLALHPLSREELQQLPLGFQRIYSKPNNQQAASEVLLLRNTKFGSLETAKGTGKPITKIVR